MTRKDDSNKLQWHFLIKNFVHQLKQVVQVLQFGAAKYGENNYRTVPNYEVRYLNALIRHLSAVVADPTARDPDTGLSHYAHVATNALFLLQYVNELPSKNISWEEHNNAEWLKTEAHNDPE